MRSWKWLGVILLLGLLSTTPALGQADEDPYAPLKRFSQILDLVEKNYVDQPGRDELINGAIEGMLQNLDPHSAYFTPADFEEMRMDTSGKFSGIGIEISMENGQLIVVTPIEDTPAYRAGLVTDDVILAIDGQPTQDMSIMDAVSKIRGPKGTKVELTILHKGDKAPIKLAIERDEIPFNSVKIEELEPGYVYLRLTRFRENTTQEMHDALKKYEGRIKGIVLDLRNNPGGLLDEAVSVADTFLSEGKIVYTKGRIPQSQIEFSAKPQPTDVSAPLVVLINAGSASASEIVAGALKDQNRALLIGEKTFGKGSVQSVVPLSDGSGIKLTTALYYTPNDISIQAMGIEPDILLPFQPLNGNEENATALTPVREENLDRHLDNLTSAAEKKGKDIDPKVLRMLKQDNQLRLGLQMVKNLPRLHSIN